VYIGIDQALLHSNRAAEDMQVVKYINGQKYDSHHDWGVSGYPESRYITLLLYLTDQKDEYAGGETAFPKGNNGSGFKIRPKKGSAILFYNLLEDGNGDDLALHAALPCIEGNGYVHICLVIICVYKCVYIYAICLSTYICTYMYIYIMYISIYIYMYIYV
jgi:hypothetical protein